MLSVRFFHTCACAKPHGPTERILDLPFPEHVKPHIRSCHPWITPCFTWLTSWRKKARVGGLEGCGGGGAPVRATHTPLGPISQQLPTGHNIQ